MMSSIPFAPATRARNEAAGLDGEVDHRALPGAFLGGLDEDRLLAGEGF
jgi:hypothetical protein